MDQRLPQPMIMPIAFLILAYLKYMFEEEKISEKLLKTKF